MSKDYQIKDYRKLVKLSSFAKIYMGERGDKKEGVSREYIFQLRDKGVLNPIIIDGVHFIDLSALPDEIKKNLKK
jgi:hypothetical protein